MNRRTLLRLLATAPLCARTTFASDALDPLSSLPLKPHPRLIWQDEQLEPIRRLVRRNAAAQAFHADLLDQAKQVLHARPIEYKLIGPRLLDKSRTCLERVRLLAFLWRLHEKQIYLRRALDELHAAAAFPDWHPPHFLDTAEMTHSFALGYDWLFNGLTPPDRDLLQNAIVAKGLDPALGAYAANAWWAAPRNNWNMVCNGGIGLGALAVGDVATDKANAVLNHVLTSLTPAMELYSPDGGWIEGPGYWSYATQYAVAFTAGISTALGRDYQLSEAPGLELTGDFRLQSVGPTGLQFNYADAEDAAEPSPEMFWLAKRFEKPAYGEQELAFATKNGAASPLDLIWFPEKLAQDKGSTKSVTAPLEAQFRGVNAGFLRTAWDDPAAAYLAAKGGDNSASHAHLDLASFVFEAGGVRWAIDLGPDDYNLPGYFEKERWSYYRLRTESHNTLLIDGENQSVDGKASLNLADGIFEIDATKAYPGRLTSWTRRLSLEGTQSVRISDEVYAPQPVEILWGMVTPATVAVEGARAVLTKDGRTLKAAIESPGDAHFEVASTFAPEPQNQNTGTVKLVVRLPQRVTAARIEVTLSLA